MELPVKFVERMSRELGPSEADALCKALGSEPSTSVRLNPLKMNPGKWDGGGGEGQHVHTLGHFF